MCRAATWDDRIGRDSGAEQAMAAIESLVAESRRLGPKRPMAERCPSLVMLSPLSNAALRSRDACDKALEVVERSAVGKRCVANHDGWIEESRQAHIACAAAADAGRKIHRTVLNNV